MTGTIGLGGALQSFTVTESKWEIPEYKGTNKAWIVEAHSWAKSSFAKYLLLYKSQPQKHKHQPQTTKKKTKCVRIFESLLLIMLVFVLRINTHKVKLLINNNKCSKLWIFSQQTIVFFCFFHLLKIFKIFTEKQRKLSILI